jgi:hypothetical protein
VNAPAWSLSDSCLRVSVTPEVTDDPCAALIGVPAIDPHVWPGSEPIAYQTSPRFKRDEEDEEWDEGDEDWDDEDEDDEDWDDEDEDDEDWDDEDEDDEDWDDEDEDDEDWDDEDEDDEDE